MNRFVATGLWDEIRVLACAPGPKAVAVAYASCADAIPFSRGDTLVTDASDQAIRTGQTSAAVLAQLQREGVNVFSVEHLHAKVFVLGGVAVIGSANLSTSSQSLVEAALVTDDTEAVKEAAGWIRQLAESAEELTPDKLAALEAIPVVRRRGESSRVLPTLAEALRDDLPVLRSYLFGMHAHGVDLSDRQVSKAVKAARLIPDGLSASDWAWYEWRDEVGLKSRIEAAYSRRPMIHLEMAKDDEGEYAAFRRVDLRPTEFIATHRINANGNAYRITVERLLNSTPGLKLRGPARSELIGVLNAGLRAEPALVKKLNRGKLGLIAAELLGTIYRLGRANPATDR